MAVLNLVVLSVLPCLTLSPAPPSPNIPGCPEQCSCTRQPTYNGHVGSLDELEVMCNRYAAARQADLASSPNLTKLQSNGNVIRLVIEQMDFQVFTAVSVGQQNVKWLKLMHNPKLRAIEGDVFNAPCMEHLEILVIVGNPSLIHIPFQQIKRMTNLKTLKLQVMDCENGTENGKSDQGGTGSVEIENEKANLDISTAPGVVRVENVDSGDWEEETEEEIDVGEGVEGRVDSYDPNEDESAVNERSTLQKRKRERSNSSRRTRTTRIPLSSGTSAPSTHICGQSPRDLFSSMTRLDSLFLRGQRFRNSLHGVTGIQSLVELNLIDLKLTDEDFSQYYPSFFDQLTQLESLSLSDNLLTCLPSSLRKASDLRALSLENNRLIIDNRSPNLSSMPAPVSLETLDLRGNDYRSFPCKLITNQTTSQRSSKLRYVKVDVVPESICLTCSSRVALHQQHCKRQSRAKQGHRDRTTTVAPADWEKIEEIEKSMAPYRNVHKSGSSKIQKSTNSPIMDWITTTRERLTSIGVPKLGRADAVNPDDYFYEK